MAVIKIDTVQENIVFLSMPFPKGLTLLPELKYDFLFITVIFLATATF